MHMLVNGGDHRSLRENESVCKPDPVPDYSGGDHPSWIAVTNDLMRSTSKYQAGRPFAQVHLYQWHLSTFLTLLRVGFT